MGAVIAFFLNGVYPYSRRTCLIEGSSYINKGCDWKTASGAYGSHLNLRKSDSNPPKLRMYRRTALHVVIRNMLAIQRLIYF